MKNPHSLIHQNLNLIILDMNLTIYLLIIQEYYY